MFKEYITLPDYMPVNELKECFYKLLDALEDSDNLDLEEATWALRELADRQWHTYETIDPELKERLEAWIEKIWDVEAVKVVGPILFVIGSLGLGKNYDMIKGSLRRDLDPEIRRRIESLIRQVDGHVEDPFYGMKHVESH